MKYVLFYEPAPGFKAKVTAYQSEHRLLWRKFQQKGEILMIGPFTDEPGGYLMGIFPTAATAEAFVAADPFVQHGVVGRWTIREWAEALVPEPKGRRTASIKKPR